MPNWGAVEKSVASGKKGKRTSYRFNIQDGETVSIRFIGGENEPYIYKRHYVSNIGGRGRYLVCAEDAAAEGKHDGCVVCAVARQQGKKGAVRLPARVYAFSVLDPRKYHVIGQDQNKTYEPCTDDARCKHCRKGDKPNISGVRHWTLAEAVTQQLKTFALDLLGVRCAECGVGSIKVVEYVCPDCGEPLEVDERDTPVRCFECEPKKVKMVLPVEVVKCSKGCKKPRRTTLADAWVMVTRSGEGTSTTYNFAAGDTGPVAEEYGTVEPVDFASHEDFQPEAAATMAALLQVQNPFTRTRQQEASDDSVPFSTVPADGPIFRR